MNATNAPTRKHRAAMRAAGLRPVQLWVPDTRVEGFVDKCQEQARLAAVADRKDVAQRDFMDAALDDFLDC